MQLGNQLSLRVNRAFAILLVFFLVHVLPSRAQNSTTIDEVHIQPRVMQPFTNGTMVSGSVPEAGPKAMKVNVNPCSYR